MQVKSPMSDSSKLVDTGPSPSTLALLSLTQDITALISLSVEATTSVVHDWFKSALGLVGAGDVVRYQPRGAVKTRAGGEAGRGLAVVVVGANEGEIFNIQCSYTRILEADVQLPGSHSHFISQSQAIPSSPSSHCRRQTHHPQHPRYPHYFLPGPACKNEYALVSLPIPEPSSPSLRIQRLSRSIQTSRGPTIIHTSQRVVLHTPAKRSERTAKITDLA